MALEAASTEMTTLSLGGSTAAVHVREVVEKPQENMASTVAIKTADAMLHDYQQNQPWPKETFHGKSGPDIMQAVRLFCQKVNFERTQQNLAALNALELDDIVTAQAKYVASPLHLLCRWTVLVRVGVRKLQRDLLGLIAMVPMPPQGIVRLSAPADNIGKTHYVLTHLLGEKFLCRGYAMHVTPEGDWVLGGAYGNRWLKDLWLTPGIQSVEAIVAAKQRKIQPGRNASDKEMAFVKKMLNDTRTRLEKVRGNAGIKAENFGAAHGARLDLENRPIMLAALSCVRAMLAQVLGDKEEQILDEIAERQSVIAAMAAQDPTKVGLEEPAFRHHMARRDHANASFRAVGRFVVPQGYLVFASQNVPNDVPESARVKVAGVTGTAISAEHLSAELYRQLKRDPAALSDIEDLTPLINACGLSVVDGQVADSVEMIEENGVEYVKCSNAGTELVKLPVADFLRKATVKFVPMVLRCKRKRIFPEDMQGSQNGIYFAMSFEDVNERFIPCPRYRSTESNS